MELVPVVKHFPRSLQFLAHGAQITQIYKLNANVVHLLDYTQPSGLGGRGKGLFKPNGQKFLFKTNGQRFRGRGLFKPNGQRFLFKPNEAGVVALASGLFNPSEMPV